MNGLVRCALLALWIEAGACGGDTSVVSQHELLQQGAQGTDALRADPRLDVAHRGVRRIESGLGSEGRVAFRERIVTDGHSRYSIEPVEALESSIPNWDTFVLVQRAREGFLFRYRDFVIRDQELFARNWITIDTGEPELVAGRSCRHLRVERRSEPEFSYDLWTDVGTGLVLASRELEGDRVASSMTYESVEFDPDLADVVWHQPSNKERAFDANANLAAELDAEILQPRLIPTDYALREAATVEDGENGRWLKLTYVDGVEPLFFFQRLPAPLRNDARLVAGTERERVEEASSVLVFELGSARAVQGTVEGFELMAIGKPRQAELLDMIESALP